MTVQMVLLMRVAVRNPVVSKSFVAGNMERTDPFECEDMHMWRDVMVNHPTFASHCLLHGFHQSQLVPP